MYKSLLFLIFIFLLNCCGDPVSEEISNEKETPHCLKSKKDTLEKKQPENNKIEPKTNEPQNPVEKSFIDAGLVDIHELDSTFVIDLKYATTDNFIGKDVYHGLKKCYLHKVAAEMLVKSHIYLKTKYPDYRLKIWDGARPRSIQQIFWDEIDKPEHLKRIYVANPQTTGSIHNYGMGVDITIVDQTGKELNMGTEFDHFSILAYPVKEQQLLKEGKISIGVVKNRELLRECMKSAGFISNKSEWWHFSATTKRIAKEHYKIIE